MDESNFHERADDMLAALFESIEVADEEGVVDADLLEGVLTIVVDEGEFVINKHEPSQQIWMSSPKSGAKHYSYIEDDDEWIDSDGEHFKDNISEELGELAGLDVEF